VIFAGVSVSLRYVFPCIASARRRAARIQVPCAGAVEHCTAAERTGLHVAFVDGLAVGAQSATLPDAIGLGSSRTAAAMVATTRAAM
jgi:hypothetical protein